MAADPIVYCLENITDYAQFERMCTDLMTLEGYKNIEPLGGFKDKGRDAVHVSRSETRFTTVFAYSVREDWSKKLRQDCEKIRKHAHACNRVVFLSTADFTPSERDAAIQQVKESFGWELDLYGLERIRVLLETTHRDRISQYPQIFTPALFLGIAGPEPQVRVSPTRLGRRQMAQFQVYNAGRSPVYITAWCAHWKAENDPTIFVSRECAYGSLPKRLLERDALDFTVYIDRYPVERLATLGIVDGDGKRWFAIDANIQTFVKTAIAHRLPEPAALRDVDSDMAQCRVDITARFRQSGITTLPTLEFAFKNYGPHAIRLREARVVWRYEPPLDLSGPDGVRVLETEGSVALSVGSPLPIVQPGGEHCFRVTAPFASLLTPVLGPNVREGGISLVVSGGQHFTWEQRSCGVAGAVRDLARRIVEAQDASQ